MTYAPPTLAASGSASIEALRDRHNGQTAYLVGKGPSLARLRASDIGPGFVLTINEAIGTVQNFGLPVQIYALQKEGCEARDENGNRPCGTCASHGWQRFPLINPYPGIVTIFSQYLASWCLHGRANRYVYDAEQFGLTTHGMSLLDAIALAKHMGAAEIVLACFDSLTSGDFTYADDPDRTEEERTVRTANLEWLVANALDALKATPHRFVTP